MQVSQVFSSALQQKRSRFKTQTFKKTTFEDTSKVETLEQNAPFQFREPIEFSVCG